MAHYTYELGKVKGQYLRYSITGPMGGKVVYYTNLAGEGLFVKDPRTGMKQINDTTQFSVPNSDRDVRQWLKRELHESSKNYTRYGMGSDE